MNSGHLRIRAAYIAGEVAAGEAAGEIRIKEVVLSRPPLTALLTGMGAEQAQTSIPLLYSLCREAQSVAATAALARAQNKTPPAFDAGKLWREMLHERLWRLCLDWPRLLNRPDAEIAVARQDFATWRKHCNHDQQADETQDKTQDFSNATRRLLAMLAEILPGTRCAFLRQEAEDILRAWREQRFYPFFSTGSASRQGQSAILTARGWLLHTAMLDAHGKIVTYRINAPTDRHFANPSPLVRQIARQTAELAPQRTPQRTPQSPAEAQNALESAVLELDPCVPWEIVWEA